MKPPKPPGPIRRALFQDVPYILDSLWRRTEFRLHRIGCVDLAAPHELKPRPAWLSVSFGLYVLVCLFAVFGPTLDAMCSIADVGFNSGARKFASIILLVASTVLFLVVLNACTLHLTRNTDVLADEACRRSSVKRKRREMANKFVDLFSKYVSKLVSPILERVYANILRLFASASVISRRDFIALALAFVVLFLGATLLIAPMMVTGVTLGKVDLDPATCNQIANKGSVYAQIAAYAILLTGGFFIWRQWGLKRSLFVFGASSLLLLAVLGVLRWKFTPEHPSEAAGGFYPHIYLYVLGIFLAVAAAARVLAWGMFRKLPDAERQLFANALETEDLLQNSREPPDVAWLRLISAAVTGVLAHLMHFALLPAFVAFVAPSKDLVWLVWSFSGVSAGLLMYATLSKRWEQMLIHIDRWFLVGTPLIVSLFVIIVGVSRLANVQYVTTVLDATPTGVLFIVMVMLYVAVWFFEYWVNRWLGDEMLGVLGAKDQARKGWLKFPFKPDPLGECPWAEDSGRHLALHSTGRFCALGWYARANPPKGEDPKGVAFTTYGLAELFYALGANQCDGSSMAHDMERRVKLYFNAINIALIVAFTVAWNWLTPAPLAVKAMVDVQEVAPDATKPLVDSLAERMLAQTEKKRPSLVVAASGGGTRAAVYTAIGLEGMAQLGRAKDVVLLSGVSGGGVAAAVFASRYGQLTTSDPHAAAPAGAQNPWEEYVTIVGAPYIQDVLEGMGETRIAGSTSLGALLQESLESRAFAHHVRTFGEIGTPGLVLNSAVSGHPYEDSALMAGRVAGPRSTGNCVEQARPYANLAGGRLVFTNLQNVSGFPQKPTEPATGLADDPPDMWLPYSIVNAGGVPLAAASALTANFPPVFSNARVRLISADKHDGKTVCPRSYFVTDGGATENLGLVSALYALLGSVKGLREGQQITDIHLLAFEASAIDYDYSDDRGIGAATGGSKERINAGLTQLLLGQVRDAVHRHGAQLHVHYLPLPVAFRSRGGFGTHWMFAPHIRVANPHVASVPETPWFGRDSENDFVVLDRKEVTSTMRAMFDPNEPVCDKAERVRTKPETAAEDFKSGWTVNVQHVARWICGYDDERGTRAAKPDYQVDAWKQAVAELRDAP